MLDEILFSLSTNSARLASLFGLDQAAAGHGNEFFQYTAPKQPKKSQGTTATGKLRGFRIMPSQVSWHGKQPSKMTGQVIHLSSVWLSTPLVVGAL